MSNKHVVTVYDERCSTWLASQGYCSPQPRPANRSPTRGEVDTALRSLGGTEDAVALRVDGPNADGVIFIRGELLSELRLLRLLAQRTGELFVYPDDGSPAFIVAADSDPEALASKWLNAEQQADSWAAYWCTETARFGGD